MSKVWDEISDAVENVFDVVKGTVDAALSITEGLLTLDFDQVQAGIKAFFSDVLAPVLEPVFNLLGIEDETIYSTSVSTTPLIPVDTQSTYLLTSILQAITSDADLSSELKYAIHTSQKVTARNYYLYGKNHFIDGVPEITVYNSFVDTIGVEAAIEIEEGTPVTSFSTELGIPNVDTWAKKYLLDNYTYVISTGILTISGVDWDFVSAELNGGGTAYQINISRDVTTQVVVDDYTQIIYDPTEFTDTWTRTTTTINHTPADPSDPDISIVDTGYTRTPTSTGAPASTSFVNISDVTTPTVETDVTPTEAPLPNDGAYYMVVYSLDSAPTVKLIWAYEVALGTYPDLVEIVVGGDSDGTQTLPVIALREEFVSISPNLDPERYNSSKKLLRKLHSLDLDTIISSIESNDDIDLIQDAFIVFGINLYSQNQSDLRYLFSFFLLLSKSSGITKAEFEAKSVSEQSTTSYSYTATSGRYNVSVVFNYAEETRIAGRIGSVGHVISEFNIVANSERSVDLENPDSIDPTETLGLINSSFTISAQINENDYIELEVSGLTIITSIVTTGTKVNVHALELVEPDTGDEVTIANAIVPLSNYVLRQMYPFDSEQVVYNGLHLVIYAEESTYLEYYQTEEFLSLVDIVLKIIAVIIFVITLGEGAGISEVLWALAEALLISVTLRFILKEVLKHNLSDDERNIAILIYAIASVLSIGNISNSALTFADIALLAVNAISIAISESSTFELNQLKTEYKEFESLRSEKEEEIKQAEEFLNPQNSIDTDLLLYSVTSPVFNLNESPDVFLNKGSMTNLADLLLDQSTNYYDNALSLDSSILEQQFIDFSTIS